MTRHPVLLAGLLLCTLLLRMVVPTGYMPVAAHGSITLQLCPGAMPAEPVAAHMAGMHGEGGERGKGGEHPGAEQPCAFAGLGTPALGAADPVLLAAAIAFAFVLVLRAAPTLAPVEPARLRPPLRAPPLTV